MLKRRDPPPFLATDFSSIPLHEFSHPIGQGRHSNFYSVRFASCQRFSKFGGLAHRNVGRHRRLKRIDDGLYQYRARRLEGLVDDGTAIRRIVDR